MGNLLIAGLDRTAAVTEKVICNLGGWEGWIYYFLIPFNIFLIVMILLVYQQQISMFFDFIRRKRGKIIINYKLPNNTILEKFFNLDKYNTFKFRSKSYNLDDLHEFIIGYKRGMPLFYFDSNFILPFKITEITMTDEIKKCLHINDKGRELTKIETESISALKIIINPNILNMILSKKLMSDLYSITGMDMDFKKKLIWILIIAVALVLAYYSGLLAMIFKLLGIDMAAGSTPVAVHP
jgi:hypothetical protein